MNFTSSTKTLSSSDTKFHFVVSTLDVINIFDTQTDSQRPIIWIPLRRLALSESIKLFNEITENLNGHRLFIIKKCIADCTDTYSSLIERFARNLNLLFV
ncbi:hypothetical protein Glove_251g25 [Diversispora epigaea]|uniref:Uncharacterized protein n=1 Tax=Diversispora epigaea TaxID=1348612 RepID=A0A397I7Z1_9GLOM|nr:hypothetical protein Glove_251g25 [Diversispora epigaea]